MTQISLKLSGIYQIKNLVTGKLYIGSAKEFRLRFNVHKTYLRKNTHCNKKLQNAWNKYGEEGFSFEPLFVCAQRDLIFYEQRALDVFDAVAKGYNINSKAESCLGTKQSPEHISKRTAGQKGSKMSKEAVEKAVATRKENGSYTYSDDYKQKMSDSMKKRFENPEEAKRISDTLKNKFQNDPSLNEKASAAQKKKYEDPSYHQKIADQLNAVRPNKKGRTYEEMYGPEKAAEIRARQSEWSKSKKRK